jgi:hypothetical protein
MDGDQFHYFRHQSVLPVEQPIGRLFPIASNFGYQASKIASQKLCAEGQSVTLPGNGSAKANSSKTIENKGGKSLPDAAWRVLTKIEKWCALQVLNLQKTSDSLGNSGSASQIASQKIGISFDGLDSVVEAWLNLPCPLKAAILAIVNSSNMARPATGLEASASEAPPKSNFPAASPSAMGNQVGTQ